MVYMLELLSVRVKNVKIGGWLFYFPVDVWRFKTPQNENHSRPVGQQNFTAVANPAERSSRKRESQFLKLKQMEISEQIF